MDLVKLGSQTAKNGFKNEKDIAEKFNQWKKDKEAKIWLSVMGYAINYFGNGKVVITKKGTIRVGEITMQRKGGDGGRTTARMLQFKINPAKLFET